MSDGYKVAELRGDQSVAEVNRGVSSLHHVFGGDTGRQGNMQMITKSVCIYTFGNSVDFISVKHNHASTDKTFYQREYIRSQFKNIKTHVVVFALGLAGKDFCSELKNNWGKCAIDMGSTVDAWAGSISRPSFGNIDSHCLTVPIDEGKFKNTDIIMDYSSTWAK